MKKTTKWICILAMAFLALTLTVLLSASWVYSSLFTGPKILYCSSHEVVWDAEDVYTINTDGSWCWGLTNDYNLSNLASYYEEDSYDFVEQ